MLISQDERAYYTFYGIEVDDWGMTFGDLSNHHKILVKNFISEDASTTSSSVWDSNGYKFFFPHHIKKKYYLEGVIEGQITFTSDPISDSAQKDKDGNISYISDFQVTLIKLNKDTTEDTLAFYKNSSVGSYGFEPYEYKVYPFWIDVYDVAQEIGENERIGIKVEWNVDNTSTTTVYLSHENWQQGEDLKIVLPFML